MKQNKKRGEPDLIGMHVREMTIDELLAYSKAIEDEIMRRERAKDKSYITLWGMEFADDEYIGPEQYEDNTLTFDAIKLCDPDA